MSRLWRILRTGLAFLIFGGGALVWAILGLPWVYLGWGGVEGRVLRARRLVHWGFRFFLWIIRVLGLFRVELEGSERLHSDETFLILANHPTLLDVVVLLSLLPSVGCIAKAELWHHVFLGWAVRAAGYVPNSDPTTMVQACAERLKAGDTMIVFPEGTRSESGSLRKFRRGPASIAGRSERRILPVYLRCDPPALGKGEKWYKVPNRPIRLQLRVGEPIDTMSFLRECSSESIFRRRMTSFLQEHFGEHLAHEWS